MPSMYSYRAVRTEYDENSDYYSSDNFLCNNFYTVTFKYTVHESIHDISDFRKSQGKT